MQEIPTKVENFNWFKVCKSILEMHSIKKSNIEQTLGAKTYQNTLVPNLLQWFIIWHLFLKQSIFKSACIGPINSWWVDHRCTQRDAKMKILW